MRFCWLSNGPWTPSGYGQQTRLFAHRIAALGHQIGIIAYHGLEGGVLQIAPNLTVLPKRFHPYGNDIAVNHCRAFGAQFMISLTDIWVMNVEEYPQNFKWIPWYPVDHDPMPPIIHQKLNSAWRRIAMSKFGVEQSHIAGVDCWYIPHGVETGVLHPVDKAEARGRLGLPKDKYIVGTVAMNKGNPSRKNFVEMMEAFARCKRRHKDWFYFLQTDPGGYPGADMVDIRALARGLGLIDGEDYGYCNQYQNAVGFPPPYFADLYSAFDVHLLVSAGEGFGIPILEAQACGTPVITSGWTANKELCLAGRMVDKTDAEPWYTPQQSYQFKPRVSAIESLLEAEFRNPTSTKKAVETIKAEYDADVIVETKWKPYLAEIEAAL